MYPQPTQGIAGNGKDEEGRLPAAQLRRSPSIGHQEIGQGSQRSQTRHRAPGEQPEHFCCGFPRPAPGARFLFFFFFSAGYLCRTNKSAGVSKSSCLGVLNSSTAAWRYHVLLMVQGLSTTPGLTTLLAPRILFVVPCM